MIVINGKSFPDGSNITIVGDKITIDGKNVTPDSKEITVLIQSSIDHLEIGSCHKVEMLGICKQLTSKNGNVYVRGSVGGDVTSKNGNITCGDVKGDVTNKNGNIHRR